MGNELAKKNDFSAAIKSYLQALQYCVDFADAHVALGAAYVALRPPVDAVWPLLTLMLCVHRYANSGRLREATAEFQKALQLEPTHVNAASYLESTQQKVGSELTCLVCRQQRVGQRGRHRTHAPCSLAVAASVGVLRWLSSSSVSVWVLVRSLSRTWS